MKIEKNQHIELTSQDWLTHFVIRVGKYNKIVDGITELSWGLRAGNGDEWSALYFSLRSLSKMMRDDIEDFEGTEGEE